MSDQGDERRAARLREILDSTTDYRARREAHGDAPPGEESNHSDELPPTGWVEGRERGNLTDNEAEALQAIADGDTTYTAGQRLHKSHWTISAQMKMVRYSLGARTAAHAVAIALRRGLIR